ncbi:MAG TPA: leucyl aminopeptidase family protein [Fibrobacteria bacterium]|nr:leucyl aminopeptidase family protein [Fibrobacteria bacterium]
MRHKIKAVLAELTSKETKGGLWVEAESIRAWVQEVSAKPGLDADERLRVAIGEAYAATQARKCDRVVFLADRLPLDRLQAALEGWWFSTYRYEVWKSTPSPKQPPLVLVVADQADAVDMSLRRTATVLESSDWIRDRVNDPGSVMTPQTLSRSMETLCRSHGLSWRALDREALEAEGYQGLITVGKGSDHSPVLGVASWEPPHNAGASHLVLVGKGVTFDTGGISIKPADHMWEMKNDMAGAATVLAAAVAIARLDLPLKVSAVVCLAENRPGNGSVLPGDIFRAKNGKTVMVENTDAEGRLILTDGLWMASQLAPTHLVDLATLTGAVVRALGSSMAGILGTSQDLIDQVREAGREVGEKFWQLPLDDEYRSKLDDAVADLRNTGGTEAGTITSTLFLREFVPDSIPWAHLDIAAPVLTTKAWKYYKEGATGFGLRTLVELARRLAQPK